MSFLFAGKTIETDDEGYLKNLNDWSEELQNYMASQMGLTLTKDHLKVISLVRSYYQEFDTTPPMRGLIKLLQKEGYDSLANSVALAKLFPDGAAKTASKLAGLPKPVKCI